MNIFPPSVKAFQLDATRGAQTLLIAATSVLAAIFPCASNAAVVVSNNETFSWSISTTAGATGNTASATNASGVLTNGNVISTANNISYTGGGASDTALTIYGYGTKTTASTKGYVIYPGQVNNSTPAAGLASNQLIGFSITAGANETLYLTNALGFNIQGGSSANVPTNYSFWTNSAPINATTGVGGNGATQLGNTVNAPISTTTNVAAGFGINSTTSIITILPGMTSYFAIVYSANLGSNTAEVLTGGSSAFSLVGYSLVSASFAYKYWAGGGAGDWNTTSTSWAASSGGTATNTFANNDFATFGSAATITVTIGGITASGITATNAVGTTVALSGGSITSSNLTVGGGGTVTLGMGNSLGTLTVTNFSTLSIGANNQGAAAVTINNSSLTGSGTVTGTSFAMSNSTISANLAGSAAMAVTGIGVSGNAAMSTNTLSGSNTYTGNTTISGGKLVAGGANAFGSGTIVLGANFSSIDLNGYAITNNFTNTASGYGQASNTLGGIMNSSSNAATISGNIAMGSSAGLQVTVGTVYDGAGAIVTNIGGTVTISGNITSGSVSKTLSKNGAGTLILSGTNTILALQAGDGIILAQGTNSIKGAILSGFGSSSDTGELRLGTAEAYTMNSASVGGALHISSVNAGSSLEFTNLASTANGSVGSANKNFITDSNTAVTFDGGFEYGGTTATKGSRTIIFQNEGPVTILGPISYSPPTNGILDGNGYIYKASGNGTLTFNGAVNLTQQASIQQGTVVIGASSSLGTYGGVILGGSNSSTLDLSALQSAGYSLTNAPNQISNNLVSNSYINNTLNQSFTNTVYNTVSATRGNGTINIGTGTITSSGITPAWYSTITTTNQSGTAGTYTTSQAFYTNAGVTAINGNLSFSFNGTAVTTLNIFDTNQAGSTISGSGTGFDQVNLANNGSLIYGGSLIINSPNYATLDTGSWSVALFNGVNPARVSGDFSSVTYNGNTLLGLAGVWTYSSANEVYQFTQGNGLFSASAVPEPRAYALSLLGLSFLCFILVRRKRSLS